MKKNNVSQKEAILEDLKSIEKKTISWNSISDLKIYCFLKIKDNCIGLKTNISLSKYIDDYERALNEEEYCILFNDSSFISFIYSFDSTNKIDKFSISFIPNPFSEFLFDKKSVFNGEYYLRIDFDPEAYVEMYHPKIHLHTSLSEYGWRIPVDTIIKPSQFLIFVVNYAYQRLFFMEQTNKVLFDTVLSKNECLSLFLKSSVK